MVQEGQLAPDFTLPDASGRTVRLSDLRGQTVVLYFYPRDDTPGCTTEACGFRDDHAAFTDRGAVVIGVSPDGPAAHARFARKHNLPFTLLADQEHTAARAYGVWKEKRRYGRTFWGVERTTFLIDRQGRIARIFRNVRPAGHSRQVLAALDAEAT